MSLTYEQKILMIVLAIVLFLFSGIGLFRKNKNANQIIFSEHSQKRIIVAQISGAVQSPGVFKLEAGKRYLDLINLAGGLIYKADINNVNLAQTIKDGELVIIPSKEKILPKTSSEQINNKININVADVNELTKITGIGKRTAQTIIDYRNKNGKIKDIRQLQKIKGIGENKADKIIKFIQF